MNGSASTMVAVTGGGWVTPFASGPIMAVLATARHANATVPANGGYLAIPDDLHQAYPHFKGELKADKAAFLTAVALEHARRTASLSEDAYAPERVGMVLGCALAGQLGMIRFANDVRDKTARFVSPINFPQTVGNYVAGAEARNFNIRGPSATLACGAASGLAALAEGCQIVATGRADVVFAGGMEQLSPELASGLSEPGRCPSEGACLFVIEREDNAIARGASVLARVGASHDLAPGEPLPADSAQAIISGTTPVEPGAILVDRCTGWCPGAIGAAAAAAAIGAAAGAEVPVVDPSDADSWSFQRLAVDDLPLTNGAVSALIFATAHDGRRRILELAITPSS